MIPEHVAAYAAGCFTAAEDPEAERVAARVKANGFGDFNPKELKEAALEWLRDHVPADVLEGVLARMGARAKLQ